MMDDNQKTLKAYDDHVQDYIDNTPRVASGHVKDWIERALKQVHKDTTILEIGSAFGRDADYIETKGYKVQRSDATPGFVELLRRNGHNAKLLNVLTDELGGPYGMVFANAVLLHFKPQEAAKVLNKMYESLQPGGSIAFTVKKGEGSSWSQNKFDAPRFFHYWQAEPLRKLVTQAGFKDIELTQGISHNAEWLHVIAKKS